MLAFDEPLEPTVARKDRKCSYNCYRGYHKNCRGRTCECLCHN